MHRQTSSTTSTAAPAIIRIFLFFDILSPHDIKLYHPLPARSINFVEEQPPFCYNQWAIRRREMIKMTITWYGHSCFKIDGGDFSAVFDPYSPGSVPGLELPPLKADMCLCSHGHDDHCFSRGVSLSGRSTAPEPKLFPTFHDGVRGTKRGKNTLTLVDMGGVRVLHMGDIGHDLSPELMEKLGRVDVLMIPVGGYYTIDAWQAADIKAALAPRLTIPMHYRGDGFGYDVLSGVEAFAEKCGDAEYFDTNIIEYETVARKCTAILKCPTKK
jgi:L-ascorbate metabolism protein UlaG (beta-lactamase superfamily)